MISPYRRSGADLPLRDPGRAHGTPLEGYFWRLTDVRSGGVVVALCGVNRAADGRRWGTVALASHPGGFVRTAIVPEAALSADGSRVSAGSALTADAGGIDVDLGPGARLRARFRGLARWPSARGGALGLGHVLPGLSQYWHPHLLDAQVDGEAELGAEHLTLDGARAYGEKNWGRGFPRLWWWGQAQGFGDPGVCVAFAGGQVDWGPVHGVASAIVIRVEGHIHRFGPPASVVRAHVSPERWELHARGPLHAIELVGQARPGDAHQLPIPVPSERRHVAGAAQHLAGTLRARLTRGRRVLFEGTSHLAGLELGAPVLEARPLLHGERVPRRRAIRTVLAD